MKKPILLFLFLSLVNLILILMISFTADSNRETIERIAPATEELREKYRSSGLSRLSPEEIKEICAKLESQISRLDRLKKNLQIAEAFFAIILVWGLTKGPWQLQPFDGLTLLLLNTLLFGLHWLFIEFGNSFEEGNNATVYLRIYTGIGLLVVQPLLFYISYRWNRLELSRKLHRQKWISVAAIVLTAASGLLALIIGIGVLCTPDLSGNFT